MKPDKYKQNTRQRPPQSSSAAPFRPRCAAQAQAGHARKTTHHTAHRNHRAAIPTPSRPHQINWGTGVFREEAASCRPPANAGKSAMGWKPAGPKPQSGFGSRQPGARGSSPRGRHLTPKIRKNVVAFTTSSLDKPSVMRRSKIDAYSSASNEAFPSKTVKRCWTIHRFNRNSPPEAQPNGWHTPDLTITHEDPLRIDSSHRIS